MPIGLVRSGSASRRSTSPRRGRGRPRSTRAPPATLTFSDPSDPVEWDADQLVAALADQAGQPAALGARARARSGRRRPGRSHSPVAASPSRPTTHTPAARELLRARPAARRRRRTGRCSTAPAAALVTVGRDVHGPVAGQHDPGGAGALRRAQQRAEVAGVGDAVDGDEERRRAASAAWPGPRAASRRAAPPWPARPAAPRSAPRRRTWRRPTDRTGTRSDSASSTMSARTSRRLLLGRAATPRAPGAGGRAAARARPGGPRPDRRRAPGACRGAAAGRSAPLLPAWRARAGRLAAGGHAPGVGERRVGALGSPARFFVPLRGGLAISVRHQPSP